MLMRSHQPPYNQPGIYQGALQNLQNLGLMSYFQFSSYYM